MFLFYVGYVVRASEYFYGWNSGLELGLVFGSDLALARFRSSVQICTQNAFCGSPSSSFGFLFEGISF